MEKIETNIEGVVNPSHPPIIGVVELAATGSALKAGTILKISSGAYAAAGNSDTPAAVLLEDVSEHASAAWHGRALFHGLAVESRLLNASQEAPNSTLLGKLPGIGIYLTQAGWTDSKFE